MRSLNYTRKLFIDLSGAGSQVSIARFGMDAELHPYWAMTSRRIVIECKSDPPTPMPELASVLGPARTEMGRPKPDELLLLDTNEAKNLAAMIEQREEAVLPILRLTPLHLLKTHTGGESGQQPAIARAFSYLSATLHAAGLSFKIQQALRELSQTGIAEHEMRRAGIPTNSLGQAVQVCITLGDSGGTGIGLAIPTTLLVHHIAKQLGVPITLNIWLLSSYRPAVGMEERLRKSLSYGISKDLTLAQQDSVFILPLATGDVRIHAPLYSRVFCIEGTGELHQQLAYLALRVATSQIFYYASETGERLRADERNIIYRAFV